jgi:hypothetical protein
LEKLDLLNKKRESEKKELEDRYYSLNYEPHLDEFQRNEDSKKMIELRRLKEKEQKVRLQKIGNYSKYVREMYWPKASTKKQLELEIIKNTIETRSIRKTADSQLRSPNKGEMGEDLNEIDLMGSGKPSKKKVGEYERPWLKNMMKTPTKEQVDEMKKMEDEAKKKMF